MTKALEVCLVYIYSNKYNQPGWDAFQGGTKAVLQELRAAHVDLVAGVCETHSC